MTTATASEVRSCIESVSLNVGSMRLKEALREASRLAPVESKDLQVRFYDTGERKSRDTLFRLARAKCPSRSPRFLRSPC